MHNPSLPLAAFGEFPSNTAGATNVGHYSMSHLKLSQPQDVNNTAISHVEMQAVTNTHTHTHVVAEPDHKVAVPACVMQQGLTWTFTFMSARLYARHPATGCTYVTWDGSQKRTHVFNDKRPLFVFKLLCMGVLQGPWKDK